jgi:hypothetical protein
MDWWFRFFGDGDLSIAFACMFLVVAVFGSAFLFFWLLAGRPGLSCW